MAKKKQKSNATQGFGHDSTSSSTTPPRSKESLRSSTPDSVATSLPLRSSRVEVVDVLCLELDADGSISSSKSKYQRPVAVLHRHDARKLDVTPKEEVIVVSLRSQDDDTDSSHLRMAGVICGEVLSMEDAGSSTRTSPGGKPLTRGRIRILPSAVMDLLIPSSALSTTANTAATTEEDEHCINLDENDLVSPTNKIAVKETAATPISTSSSPSFSFKIGGGGDALYSPSTPSNQKLKQPKSKQPSVSPCRKSSSSVWVVPSKSNIGAQIRRKLYRTAAVLQLQVTTMNDRDAPPSFLQGILRHTHTTIFHRIVLAQLMGRMVQPNELMNVTFQGRGLTLQVQQVLSGANVSSNIDNEAVDSVTDQLQAISIDNEIASVDPVLALHRALSTCTLQLFEVTYSTQIEMLTSASKAETSLAESESHSAAMASPTPPKQYVAGLDMVVSQVRNFLISLVSRSEWLQTRKLKAPRGMLLHGPSGVGKTALMHQLVDEIRHRKEEYRLEVEFVNCVSLQSQTAIVGQAERELSRLFRRVPTSNLGKLLVLDDVHLICPKRGNYNGAGVDRLTATLLSLMDGLDSSDLLFILAITHSPSMLDPALRRPGRIDAELEVPLPDDASSRASILQFQVQHLGMKDTPLTEEQWIELGKLAKGFNGADCMLAVKEAMRHSIFQQSPSDRDARATSTASDLTWDDLCAGIRATKPSAIKSITVEIPQVLWSDIGGMEAVKEELRDAIELPLAHGDLFVQLRIPPPRGLLLYGPPGCSKTLMARALATQGNMNFLAVKGPELLSKWLGESERALASLFRRARMASPAIIFFDEIDAIACKRGMGETASNRLLSQLLTELDGVHHTGSAALSSLGGNSEGTPLQKQQPKQQRVVVIGATNRPDLLDPALTRPGRIDRMIYVGVPDATSRAQIFRLGLRGRACSSDIDIAHLAQDEVSGGYSGAEIVALCRDAALFALEEADTTISDGGHNDEASILSQLCLEQRHLMLAIAGRKRQITPDMIAFYNSFREKTTIRVS